MLCGGVAATAISGKVLAVFVCSVGGCPVLQCWLLHGVTCVAPDPISKLLLLPAALLHLR